MTPEKAIAAYIKIRDQRDETQKRHKEELAPTWDALKKIEGWLHRELQRDGLSQYKGKGIGTAFIHTSSTAKVVDWNGALLPWIKANDAFELLEARVSKTVVRDYITNSGGKVPPGIDWQEIEIVQVRRD